MRRIKGYLMKEEAVAGAVTVVLVIALATLIFGYYVSTIVPSEMSQYEFSMDQGLTASTLTFASYLTTMKTNGIVGAIDYQNFILESSSVPIITTPSYATLTTTSFVKNQSTSYYIHVTNSQVESPVLPTSWFFGGGGLTLSNGNRFYNPAYLFYQGGSVYEITRSNAVPLSPSAIFQYSAGFNTYYLNTFQIYGSIQQSSTGSFDLQLEYSGTSTLNTTAGSSGLSIAVWFNSTATAQMFYDTMTSFQNLNPNLKGNYVYFTIPQGANIDFTISSYTVSAYVQVKQ